MDNSIHLWEALFPEEADQLHEKLEVYRTAVARLSEIPSTASMMQMRDLEHVRVMSDFWRDMVALAIRLAKPDLVAGLKGEVLHTGALLWEQRVLRTLFGDKDLPQQVTQELFVLMQELTAQTEPGEVLS